MSLVVRLLVGYLSMSLASPLRGASDSINAGDEQVRFEGHQQRPQKLHGRFLHITDLHPDPFYKVHSSTEEDAACHRGVGPAGFYGAETTDCDSPYSLINETFQWVDEHLRDSIDFVVWTGDSARHANDEKIPRTEKQVLDQNRFLADQFVKIFRRRDASHDDAHDDDAHDDDAAHDKGLLVPIIPTIGNNDVMPHNHMDAGPNRWTRAYKDIWRSFIPKTQRKMFEKNGWFMVEVIPNQLAVISMNTMYFYASNPAVEGCSSRSEPGYAQFEWLREELQGLRERGMKAILIGHVPPARTDNKMSWYESCWQKYTLWNRQYRDILVGSFYGHMNIGHFFFQDSEEVDIDRFLHEEEEEVETMLEKSTTDEDNKFSTQSAADYLIDLRYEWSRLPRPPKSISWDVDSLRLGKDHARKNKKKEKKYLKEIGGEWAERYIVTHVSPSVIPNAFPSLRVMEYNISGVESYYDTPMAQIHEDGKEMAQDEKKETIKKHFKIPHSPSKSTPPGPAYSLQPFTLTGFIQYVANITHLNNDFIGIDGYSSSSPEKKQNSTATVEEGMRNDKNEIEIKKWHPGKFNGRKPPPPYDNDDDEDDDEIHPRPKKFHYEISYQTQHDSIFGLNDLTIRRYLELAGRIGQFKPDDGVQIEDAHRKEMGVLQEDDEEDEEEETMNKKHKHKHGKKHKKRRRRKALNKIWFAFIQRAFVGALDDEEIHERFGEDPEFVSLSSSLPVDEHDHNHVSTFQKWFTSVFRGEEMFQKDEWVRDKEEQEDDGEGEL
ncbi:MAG: Endopolyphosphatase [Watsoniomyces obsoletus]|nr:MAG: Endopolyphosphatase [Watsoniomyces obsoletus]